MIVSCLAFIAARAQPVIAKTKGGEPMKKFVIREVETVKTTAAFYECTICLPDWICAILGGGS